VIINALYCNLLEMRGKCDPKCLIYLYTAQVFVLAERRVRTRGYATMFGLQTRNKDNAMSKFVFSFSNSYAQVRLVLSRLHKSNFSMPF